MRRFLKRVKNRQGMTLLELIVVIAIMGFVGLTAFSLLLFGQRTFALSDKRAQDQFDTRMPANFIAEQLRFANTAVLISAVPSSFAPGTNYIFYNPTTKKVMFHEGSSTPTPIPGVSSVSDYVMSMELENYKTISFNIGKVGGSSSDQVSSQVVPLNVSAVAKDSSVTSFIGVRYTLDATMTLPPPIITGLVTSTITDTELQYVPYTPPLQVDVFMTDGLSTFQSTAPVIWTGTVNTDVVSTYTLTGSVVGHSVTLNVTVQPMFIQSVPSVTKQISVGAGYSAPTTIDAVLVNDLTNPDPVYTTTKPVSVTWTWPTPYDTTVAGTYTATGAVLGFIGTPPTLTLTVTPKVIEFVPNITKVVGQGETVLLPPTVSVKYVGEVILGSETVGSWSPSTFVTTTPGTYISTGTIVNNGTTHNFTYTLTVNPKLADPIPICTVSGQHFTVKVTGQVGSTVVMRYKSDGSPTIQETQLTIGAGGNVTFSSIHKLNSANVYLEQTGFVRSNTVAVTVP